MRRVGSSAWYAPVIGRKLRAVGKNLVAQSHALRTDVDARTRDHAVHLILAFAAKRADKLSPRASHTCPLPGCRTPCQHSRLKPYQLKLYHFPGRPSVWRTFAPPLAICCAALALTPWPLPYCTAPPIRARRSPYRIFTGHAKNLYRPAWPAAARTRMSCPDLAH